MIDWLEKNVRVIMDTEAFGMWDALYSVLPYMYQLFQNSQSWQLSVITLDLRAAWFERRQPTTLFSEWVFPPLGWWLTLGNPGQRGKDQMFQIMKVDQYGQSVSRSWRLSGYCPFSVYWGGIGYSNLVTSVVGRLDSGLLLRFPRIFCGRWFTDTLIS